MSFDDYLIHYVLDWYEIEATKNYRKNDPLSINKDILRNTD